MQDYRNSTVGVSDSPVGDTDVSFGSNDSEPTIGPTNEPTIVPPSAPSAAPPPSSDITPDYTPRENTSAGTSSRGRRRTLSKRMADSIEQKEFFGNTSMHYMVSLASDPQDHDALHDWHLELQ